MARKKSVLKKAQEELLRLKDVAINNRHNKKVRDNAMLAAKRLKLRTRAKMPKTVKALICKKCDKFLFPGITCTVRINTGKVVYTCKNCKHMRRISLK